MKIQVGDLIMLYDDGCFCTTYDSMARDMKLTRWAEGQSFSRESDNGLDSFKVDPPVEGTVKVIMNNHIAVDFYGREYILSLGGVDATRYFRVIRRSERQYFPEGLFEV